MAMSDLSLERLISIGEAFRHKGWSIESDEEIKAAFDSTLELSAILSHEDFQIFLQFLRNFERIEWGSYVYRLSKAFDKVPEKWRNVNHARIIPLISPKNIGEAKSGAMLVYPFYHKIISKISYKSVEKYDNYSNVQKRVTKDDFVTFILDDFIGTGQTASEFLEFYTQNYLSYNEKLVFISIAGMESGIQHIQSLGHEVYVDYVARRAIADIMPENKRSEAYLFADFIQSQIHCSKNFTLGFRRSEALVTLIRTPNNTLPMFWHDSRNPNFVWRAPFPR